MGELRLALGKRREKTSRNCSRLVATLRISFSPAFPARKKCLDFTPIHVSFAATGESSLRLNETYVAERRARQKAKAPRFILSPPNSANLNRSDQCQKMRMASASSIGRLSPNLPLRREIKSK